MCTYLNGKLIAFTGELPPDWAMSPTTEDQAFESTEVGKTYNSSVTREGFHVPEGAKRYTRNRGGSDRNCGRKARYSH
jgi:hypothetical protein